MDHQRINNLYCYEYARPAVAADVVVFTIAAEQLQVLLIRRGGDPFAGRWAIPGGFVEMDETLEAAALRELREETGAAGVPIEQLHTFGDPGRDPRGRVISVSFMTLLDAGRLPVRAGDDAAAVAWHLMQKLPPLAFDHAKVLALALRRLREKTQQTPVGALLLPRQFELAALRRIHEIILSKKLAPAAWRKRLLDRGIIKRLPSGKYAFRSRTGG
jgi:8-oxo-dGTP diphosphatase